MDLLINSNESLEIAIQLLRDQYADKRYLKVKVSYGRQRTLTQNRALHKYCDLLACALNEAGLDQRKVLKPSVDIPWTMDAVKTGLWKPVQEAVTGLKSTTNPEASQYSAIYEVLNNHLSSKLGIYVGWPSKDGVL
jgi:hypothetical protein